jgi:hypothetical protein
MCESKHVEPARICIYTRSVRDMHLYIAHASTRIYMHVYYMHRHIKMVNEYLSICIYIERERPPSSKKEREREREREREGGREGGRERARESECVCAKKERERQAEKERL